MLVQPTIPTTEIIITFTNKTFTGRILRRQRGGDVRGNVRFPVERWNCYDLVMTGCPKTNNIQEGKLLLGFKSFYKFTFLQIGRRIQHRRIHSFYIEVY